MSRTERALIAIALVVFGASVIAQQTAPAPAAPTGPIPAGLPEWAYTPPNPPGSPPPPLALPTDDAVVVRIPGVTKTMTRGELRGVKEIPDWYPEERHGAVPAVVKVGRLQEGVRACGFCHLADGTGRPENAPVNGLSITYFTQQMEDFKNGLRDSADPRKNNTNIESRTAPKVRLQSGMHMAVPAGQGGGMEPLSNDEIVEVPDDNLRAEARDTRMGWTAYVPVGTLNKGKAVAARSQCAVCHGANLEGVGPVPPLAGRSPSYTMRQLFDMKEGTRRGPWSELMKPIVDKMSVEDMLNVSAYAASLAPQATAGARGTR